jgi:hypothetical protein
VRLLPITPMGRVHRDQLFGLRVHPSVESTVAWKDERVWPAMIHNGQFQIAAKRRGDYGLPFHNVQ